MRRLGEQDLAHAVELARCFGDGAAIVAGDEDIDIAAELACAAVSALAVAGASVLLSCSASSRTAI